jgi:hypothetical protein
MRNASTLAFDAVKDALKYRSVSLLALARFVLRAGGLCYPLKVSIDSLQIKTDERDLGVIRQRERRPGRCGLQVGL